MNSSPLSPLLQESSCRSELNFKPLLKLFHPPCVLDSMVLSMLEEVIMYISFLVWVIICACYLFLTRPSAWIILLHLPFICLTSDFLIIFFYTHPHTYLPQLLFFLSEKIFLVFSVLKLHALWFSSSFWSKGVEVQWLSWDYRINSHDHRINKYRINLSWLHRKVQIIWELIVWQLCCLYGFLLAVFISKKALCIIRATV